MSHFLNPAFVYPGLALIALPIIIHLINRLHYRRVRFAAMEFLLASEQKSRRRVLLEQLLLLLLRCLMVLAVMLLLARLVLSASQLSLFQGAKSHHVVLLDDSGSLRDRLGETSAFDDAKAIVRRLVAEGANRPGTQRFTLLLASRPDETLAGLSERDIDDTLVDEVTTRLEDLECSYGAIDLPQALEAVRLRLAADRTDLKHLHVLSDFRKSDWHDDQSVAAALLALGKADVAVNLVRTVASQHDNMALTDLSGAVEVAAAGVPVSLRVGVANYGTRAESTVRVGVRLDGRPVPMNLVFDEIPAGGAASRDFALKFETAGAHRLEVTLKSDALEQDNSRFLAVAVPESNPVLIVDGTPGAGQGLYISDALAAVRSVTGYAATVTAPDALRKSSIDPYQLIYLVNVPELPADALAALEDYVRGGGGLAWFLGDQVVPAYYNDKLYREGSGLFPAPLSAGAASLAHADGDPPDIVPGRHPLFEILAGADNPFLDLVFVNQYFTLESGWEQDVLPESKTVAAIARLRNGRPLMLEHKFGEGRVITCLTSAGPLPMRSGEPWTNWANGPAAPSYAVFQLDLAKYVARRDRTLPRAVVGEPLRESFSRLAYADQVEFVAPDGTVSQIRAAAESDDAAGTIDSELHPLVALFRDTQAPGVYLVRLTSPDQRQEERLVTYNVPVDEGRMELATDEQLRAATGVPRLAIQPAGSFDWIRSESPGEDVRWFLLAILVVLSIAEQALAYRLSYHPPLAAASAT